MKYSIVLVLTLLALAGCAGNNVRQAEIERITPEQLAKLLPPPVATVTLAEIVTDSKQGRSADEIIAKIKASNSRYELTPTQALDLNKQGVDVRVLDYMQQSNELAKQNAIADEMNKRLKERAAAKKILKRERDLARDQYNNQFYDPFWGPGFGGFYGRPYYGSHFGYGASFGRRFGYPYGW